VQIQKTHLLGDSMVSQANRQRDCFVADAPRKDNLLSLRAKRSNLTENAEVYAIDYGIHGLRILYIKEIDAEAHPIPAVISP